MVSAWSINSCLTVNGWSRGFWIASALFSPYAVQPTASTEASTPISSAPCCRTGVDPTRNPVFRSCEHVPAFEIAMHTTAPIIRASRLYAEPSQPTARKTAHVAIKTPIVIPDSGDDVEPTSPVIRDETTENRKPSTRMRTAPSKFILKSGIAVMNPTIARAPPTSTGVGVSRSVRTLAACPAPPVSDRADARIDDTITGSARINPKMPPVATAPAPMCRTYWSQTSAGCMLRISSVAGASGSLDPEPNKTIMGTRISDASKLPETIIIDVR